MPAIEPKNDESVKDCTSRSQSPISKSAPPATSANFSHESFSLTPLEDEFVNLDHTEHLVHLVADGFDLLGNATVPSPTAFFTYAVRRGLQCPYLLCQMLALSARHSSSTRSSQSDRYYSQALALQTRALSLFNEAIVTLDESNCVDVMIFATMLGHHLLTDTLAVGASRLGDLNVVVEAFTSGLCTHRGAYSIGMFLRPTLINSDGVEFKQTCAQGASFLSSEPRGKQCQLLYDLCNRNTRLTSGEKDSLYLMIRYLQIGIDALSCDETKDRHQMIYSWPMLAPEHFTTMMDDKRPEALVLLGWYAALLHHGRSMWQVGEAGASILDLTSAYLGDSWSFELKYPRDVINGRSE